MTLEQRVAAEIDTGNVHLVAARMGATDSVVVMLPPTRAMTPAEALTFAAWLVVVAESMQDDDAPSFEAYRRAVENT